jgi:TfoX/Sxy family transcriptional regulator of competence genes
MFGGIIFMINDKMCIGVMQEVIMLRVLPEFYDALLEENDVRPMDFIGRITAGFVCIDAEDFKTERQLKRWVDHGLDFAERGVVKSKKRKKINVIVKRKNNGTVYKNI